MYQIDSLDQVTLLCMMMNALAGDCYHSSVLDIFQCYQDHRPTSFLTQACQVLHSSGLLISYKYLSSSQVQLIYSALFFVLQTWISQICQLANAHGDSSTHNYGSPSAQAIKAS